MQVQLLKMRYRIPRSEMKPRFYIEVEIEHSDVIHTSQFTVSTKNVQCIVGANANEGQFYDIKYTFLDICNCICKYVHNGIY